MVIKYISAFIFFASAIFSFFKIKKGCGLCTKDISPAEIKIGAVLCAASLTALNALNFSLSSAPLFPIVIWGLAAVFLICAAVFYGKSCKNVKRIVDLLNKAGYYKDIADALFTGFLHFGTSMPPRGFSKESRIYAQGFKDLARTALEQNGCLTADEFSELIGLQKIVRTKNLFETMLIAAVAAWFLMIPTAVIIIIMLRS